MITAKAFVDAAAEHGIDWFSGVPCSFLTPFIDHVINAETLSYVSAANEGDAVAAAAGAVIGGRGAAAMMQNSGLGNAVSPLTSLAQVFRIPILLICTHRGQPGLRDEPQHALMGRITARMLELMEVPWEPFPSEDSLIEPALERIDAHFAATARPYGLLMSKGTIAKGSAAAQARPQSSGRGPEPVEPYAFSPGGTPCSRQQVLQRLVELTSERNCVLIATTGFTGRELYAIADRPNHFYMVGSMGCAASLGLGLSLARPDLEVIVIDGDGAALMRMGNLATVGAYAGSNFIHLLLDNHAHDSTGAQATVSATVDFARIAAGCGYGRVLAGRQLDLIEALLEPCPHDRARFAHLEIRTGTMDPLPRPDIEPPQVLRRLMQQIGSGSLA